MGYRKQLPIRTECLNFMNKRLSLGYRIRSVRQIEDIYKKTMQYRMTQAPTLAEKRAVIAEVNPLFYVFGENRKVFKPYQTYEENYGIE